MVRNEAAFVLDSEAGEFSIGRPAQNHVAGVVGVFDKGGEGVFSAEDG